MQTLLWVVFIVLIFYTGYVIYADWRSRHSFTSDEEENQKQELLRKLYANPNGGQILFTYDLFNMIVSKIEECYDYVEQLKEINTLIVQNAEVKAKIIVDDNKSDYISFDNLKHWKDVTEHKLGIELLFLNKIVDSLSTDSTPRTEYFYIVESLKYIKMEHNKSIEFKVEG